ncbi:MAG: ABC transporter permease [Spirochaetota bacterium]
MKKLALVFLLAAWYLLSLAVNKAFLPPPHVVLSHTISQLLAGNLSVHLLISLWRITAAMLISLVLAVPLALAAGRKKAIDNLLSPTAGLLYPIPKAALLPIIMLFLGLGDASKITLIALIIFFQLFFVVRDAAAGIDNRYIDSIRSLGAGRREIIFHVLIPSVLPGLFTALRISSGTAAAVLFLAETFASITGLGWYIIDSWARLNYLDMYAGIVCLSMVGALLFLLFDRCEQIFCSWRS